MIVDIYDKNWNMAHQFQNCPKPNPRLRCGLDSAFVRLRILFLRFPFFFSAAVVDQVFRE